MKINETQRVGSVNAYKRVNEAGGAASGTGKTKKKDELVISSEAKEMLENQGTVSNERLDNLKESIATGTYHVEARKIAEKLFPFIK
jgi:negative regulator of flagellin synthesis FlgM